MSTCAKPVASFGRLTPPFADIPTVCDWDESAVSDDRDHYLCRADFCDYWCDVGSLCRWADWSALGLVFGAWLIANSWHHGSQNARFCNDLSCSSFRWYWCRPTWHFNATGRRAVIDRNGHFNFSLAAVLTVQGLGAASSNIVAGFIVDHYDYGTAYLFHGLVAVLAIALFMFVGKEIERSDVSSNWITYSNTWVIFPQFY